MNIAITSVDFDPLGHVRINADPNSDLRTLTRRVNRVATLDLGVAINDRGFSHGDRTFRITWKATRATNDRVAYIEENHSRVKLTTEEGVFLCVIERAALGKNQSSLTALVISKES